MSNRRYVQESIFLEEKHPYLYFFVFFSSQELASCCCQGKEQTKLENDEAHGQPPIQVYFLTSLFRWKRSYGFLANNLRLCQQTSNKQVLVIPFRKALSWSSTPQGAHDQEYDHAEMVVSARLVEMS